jgi:hypothetical protein
MDTRPGMLRSQRNQIFRILQERNVPTVAFRWTTRKAPGSSAWPAIEVLAHDDPPIYISMWGDNDGEFRATFWPSGSAKPASWAFSSWSRCVEEIATWADRVRRELAEPDLWSSAAEQIRLANLRQAEDLRNDPFSYDEALRITAQLGLLSEKLSSQEELTDSLKEEIGTKLDYLADAVKRQGRLDWFHTALGVFATIAVGLEAKGLDVQQFRDFFRATVGKASVFLLGT